MRRGFFCSVKELTRDRFLGYARKIIAADLCHRASFATLGDYVSLCEESVRVIGGDVPPRLYESACQLKEHTKLPDPTDQLELGVSVALFSFLSKKLEQDALDLIRRVEAWRIP